VGSFEYVPRNYPPTLRWHADHFLSNDMADQAVNARR
jgi:hypothetical protein